MVERPIKKADRQLNPETSEAKPRQSDESNKKRSSRDSGSRDGGGKGKRDKKGGRDAEVKAPVNLALVRGPKPTKPKPAVEEAITEAPEAPEESTET